ncbi:glycosyltransferase family 32 protein [Mariniflexile maritimum]|uniref:glycosyltransferase family 32 protein n=1 Tax=Mariniflexile maritimum TaxID=2682493 RepID=UPI0012F64131|nr:glycosyltransferase [Mariniflexile maritimum]
MIPKTIHYCWFGKNKKSNLIEKCIQSWKFHLPDYKIIEWNEDNFDIRRNAFISEAYEKRKWAFVSDYVRVYVLYHYGGIYLDTDVEIRCNLDRFLTHGAFSGFEDYGYPFTALWGSSKEHNWPKNILEYYENLNGFDERTNTRIVSEFLINHYKVDPFRNETQKLEDDICIYPSHFFCLNIEQNYAVHHFEGSWHTENIQDYNAHILKDYYKKKFLDYYKKENIVEELHRDKWFTVKDLAKFILKRIKRKYFKQY